jgi:hypothetical protein
MLRALIPVHDGAAAKRCAALSRSWACRGDAAVGYEPARKGYGHESFFPIYERGLPARYAASGPWRAAG